jgi:hypothetical protein
VKHAAGCDRRTLRGRGNSYKQYHGGQPERQKSDAHFPEFSNFGQRWVYRSGAGRK